MKSLKKDVVSLLAAFAIIILLSPHAWAQKEPEKPSSKARVAGALSDRDDFRLDHGVAVFSVAFLNNNIVVGSDNDNDIALWDLTTKKGIATLSPRSSKDNHVLRVNEIACGGGGKIIAAAVAEEGVFVYNATDPTNPKIMPLPDDILVGAESVSFSGNGTVMAVGYEDNQFAAWSVDPATLQWSRRWATRVTRGSINKLRANADGTRIAIALRGLPTNLLVFDATNGTLVRSITTGTVPVVFVSYSTEGFLASAQFGGHFRLLDSSLNSIAPSKIPPDIRGSYDAAAFFSPRTLVYATHENNRSEVVFWNFDIGIPASSVSAEAARDLAFSPSRKLLAIADGNTIHIWPIPGP